MDKIHRIIIGTDCIENPSFGCEHVIHLNGNLESWSIKTIRDRIKHFGRVCFVSNNITVETRDLNDKQFRHFTSNPIRQSQSESDIL